METYCTLEQVRALLGLGASAMGSDELIFDSINAVSRAIDEACSTQFFAVTQTRYYTSDNPYCLLTDDLLSVTSLKTDADGDGTFETTWSASDYTLAPYNAAEQGTPRPYWQIETRPGGARIFPTWTYVGRTVEITGAWGFCAAGNRPSVVQQVALRESLHHVHALRSPYGAGGPGSPDNVVQLPIGLSERSKGLLAPFMRKRIG